MMPTASRFSASLLALATATALAVTACSSGNVPVGATDQQLQKQKDGGSTGDGQTCAWDTPVANDLPAGPAAPPPVATGPFHLGDTFKSPDGCNDCQCVSQGIMCTNRACTSPPGGGTCSYGGKAYAAGQGFPSIDGCNSCGCQADGSVVCTEKACAPSGCTYGGKSYPDGVMFPSIDSCNTCTCSGPGVSCTEISCAFTCPAQTTINCMPVVPPEAQALCSGSYHDWIIANCNVQFVY